MQNVAVVCNSAFSIDLGLLVVWKVALEVNVAFLHPLGIASRANVALVCESAF